MVIACEMLTMSLDPHMTTKSSWSTSFPITCLSVSETIGFLDDPRSNTET